MAPKVMGEKEGKLVQLFGWDTEAAGKEYSEFLHQFLAALKPELVKLGISEVTYFHISDEPSQEQFDSYKAAKEVVEKDLEGYQMMDALSDYEFYEKGLVSQPVCAVNHIQPFLEKRPEKLWGYYCTGQYVDVTNRFIVQPGYVPESWEPDVQIPAGWIPTGATTSPQCRTFHLPNRSISLYGCSRCISVRRSFPVYPGADKRAGGISAYHADG